MQLARQVAATLTDGQAAPNRPLGIILVRHQRARQRHDAVAGELRDRSARPFHFLAKDREVRIQESVHVLDIEGLGTPRELGQVGEQRRHNPARRGD